MATLAALEQAGALRIFRPPLDPDQEMERSVYLEPTAFEWCYSSTQLRKPAPNDKAFDLVHAQLKSFVVGELMQEGPDFRRLKSRKSIIEVWECKTRPPDAVRMFGWFYRRGLFIVSKMEYKNIVVSLGYGRFIREVSAYRDSLALDHPKLMKGNRFREYL